MDAAPLGRAHPRARLPEERLAGSYVLAALLFTHLGLICWLVF